MNEQEKMKSSEERKNEICICDCGYYPLKHFEKCPICKCEAFHLVINKFAMEKIKNGINNTIK